MSDNCDHGWRYTCPVPTECPYCLRNELDEVKSERDALLNTLGVLRDMCVRGYSYKLADRLVAEIDATIDAARGKRG